LNAIICRLQDKPPTTSTYEATTNPPPPKARGRHQIWTNLEQLETPRNCPKPALCYHLYLIMAGAWHNGWKGLLG